MDGSEDYLFDCFYIINELMDVNDKIKIIVDNNSNIHGNIKFNFESNKEEGGEYEIEEESDNEEF